METTTFMADPTRLMIAAAVGIVCLLVLIIKFKLHPVISMMISAIIIGVGAGMPLTMISDTVEKGVGKTLQGIALLVGLGSMFGGILEVSGGAQKIAQTLIDKFGQKKAGWALGLTGLVIGTTVFFEAGVVVLIPLAFSVAKQTRKSTLYYAIPLLSGLASGYAFVPPSAGSVLVANALGVNLGTMIMVGVPTALVCMLVSGVIWGTFIGNKMFTKLPANVEEIHDDGKELPSFGLVLVVILITYFNPTKYNFKIHAHSWKCTKYFRVPRKTIFSINDRNTCGNVFFRNPKRIYRRTIKEDFRPFIKTSWNDTFSNRQWWSDSLDVTGLRSWNDHRTCIGEEWTAIDLDRIFDRIVSQSFRRKFHRGNDNGIWSYGNNASRDGNQYVISCSDVLCDLWRSHCIKSCE